MAPEVARRRPARRRPVEGERRAAEADDAPPARRPRRRAPPRSPRRQPADARADGLLARQRCVGSGGGGARGDRAAHASDEPAARARLAARRRRGDPEALLEPLRQLADAAKLQSTHNRGALRERLIPFGERLGACVDLADVIIMKMTGGAGDDAAAEYDDLLGLLRVAAAPLAPRHDSRLAVWWPAPWTAGFDGGYRSRGARPLGPADPYGRVPPLGRDPRIDKSAKKPPEVWREIEREPGVARQVRARCHLQGGGESRRATADRRRRCPPLDHVRSTPSEVHLPAQKRAHAASASGRSGRRRARERGSRRRRRRRR